MATNGIVSITQGGEVILKIVVGCDGYNANKVAHAIIEAQLATASPATVYDFIEDNCEFGCSNDRAVMSKDAIEWRGDDDLPESYRDTFHLPTFNPRLMPDGGGAMTVVHKLD